MVILPCFFWRIHLLVNPFTRIFVIKIGGDRMFKIEPKCSKCGKGIKGNEKVNIQMKYPAKKGFTEIKAYLQNEGQFICAKPYLEVVS